MCQPTTAISSSDQKFESPAPCIPKPQPPSKSSAQNPKPLSSLINFENDRYDEDNPSPTDATYPEWLKVNNLPTSAAPVAKAATKTKVEAVKPKWAFDWILKPMQPTAPLEPFDKKPVVSVPEPQEQKKAEDKAREREEPSAEYLQKGALAREIASNIKPAPVSNSWNPWTDPPSASASPFLGFTKASWKDTLLSTPIILEDM